MGHGVQQGRMRNGRAGKDTAWNDIAGLKWQDREGHGMTLQDQPGQYTVVRVGAGQGRAGLWQRKEWNGR